MSSIKKSPMNDDDELDVACLAADSTICPYRIALRIFFGHDVKLECNMRKSLKKRFDQYKADIEHKKFHDEYPGDVPDIKP